ncbi:MAG: mechanosensitive ion channel family protein [Saprospiraceae bacterium]
MLLKNRLFLFVLLLAVSPLQAQNTPQSPNETPYSVVFNHLYYLQRDSYQPNSAARSFNMRTEDAIPYAIKLKQVLDARGMYIDINRLPESNVYFDTISGSAIYFLDRDEPAIYVERVGNRWFYSRTTIAALPTLYEDSFPFGGKVATLFQAPQWQKQLFNIEIWKWLGLFLAFLCAVVVYYLVRWISNKAIYPFVKRRFGVSEGVRKSVKRLARLIGLWIGLRSFIFLLPAFQLPPLTNAMVLKGLGVLHIFFLVFIVNQVINVLFFNLRKVAERTENTLDDQLLPVLKRLASILVWSVGIIYILNFLDVNVTALLAGISIGGLAIALAAQDTVKNFFGSIMIFLDKPFQIGDWIHFGSVDGVVEEVGIRSTRIRTFANSITYVPNGMLADQVVDNMGLRVYRRFKTDIGITYDTPPATIDLFVKGIKQIILQHPTSRKDYFEVHLNSFGASSLNILLYTFFEAPNWTAELRGRHEMMYAILVLADDLGVRFAFPTQTLHIEEFPGKGNTTPTARDVDENSQALENSLKRISAYFQEKAGTNAAEGEKFKPLGGE